MLHVERNSLPGISFTDFISPESRETFSVNLKSIFQSGLRQSFDLQLCPGNGALLYVCLECVPVQDTTGNINLCRIAVSDITWRKQMEETLKERKAFMASLLTDSPDPVILFNSDGTIRHINRAVETLTGYSNDEVAGSSTPHPWWPEEYAEQYQQEKDSFRTIPGEITERCFRKKTGEDFWVYIVARSIKIDGEIKYYLSNWMNITRLKLVEENLKASREMFSIAFNTAPIPMAILTLAEGKFIDVNHSSLKITGLSRDRIIGQLITRFPFCPDVPKQNQIAAEIRNHANIHDLEVHFQSRNGASRTASLFAEKITLGGMDCVIAAAYDITERKRLEETLTNSNRLLEEEVKKRTAELLETLSEANLKASILDMASDAVLGHTLDGTLFYANEAARILYGYTRDELMRLNVRCLFTPQGASDFENGNEKIIKHGEARMEGYHKHKDGSLVPVEVHSRLIEMNGRQSIISIIRNITKRINIEKQIKYQAMLIDNVSDAIISTDLNFKIISWNKAAEMIYGWTEQEVIGKDMSEATRGMFPPEQYLGPTEKAALPPEQSPESFADVLKYGQQLQGERIHFRKDGHPIRISASVNPVRDHSGNMIGSVAIIRDITEVGRINAKIRHSELRLRSILDSMTEGTALIMPDGTVAMVNKAEVAILGLKSPEERIGRHFQINHCSPVYPDGTPLPLEKSAIAMAIKRKRSIQNFKSGLVKPDGSTIWVSATAVPIIDDSGQLLGVVRTMTDITEQKKLTDEREQFTRKILNIQEEERKKISRELHDSTAQYLALLMLEMEAVIEKDKQLPLETITHLQRLRDTVASTLQEVRRFSHELRPSILEHLGLPAALELIISEFNNSCPVNVRFNTNSPEKRLSNEIELALFRITQEALNNIRKHSEADQAEVNLSLTSRKIRLTISDNGKGFKIQKQEQIIRKGSLGLIGMRERAHLIGATLNLKSIVNKGTTIKVELPLK
jgi:PAS domain S-box-containing protein